jgi:uncharacterized protein YndB with AHSA1/START domain
MTMSGEPAVTIAEDVTLEIRIGARPETVFPFFTDPELMVQWKGTRAELDPRPGGAYRVDMNPQARVRGEYLEVDPPRRVVFTWGWEGEGVPVAPGSSTVAIDLTPDGDGTLVRLTHSGLPSDEMKHAHVDGWNEYMPRLKRAAQGEDPGPDPHAQPTQ